MTTAFAISTALLLTLGAYLVYRAIKSKVFRKKVRAAGALDDIMRMLSQHAEDAAQAAGQYPADHPTYRRLHEEALRFARAEKQILDVFPPLFDTSMGSETFRRYIMEELTPAVAADIYTHESEMYRIDGIAIGGYSPDEVIAEREQVQAEIAAAKAAKRDEQKRKRANEQRRAKRNIERLRAERLSNATVHVKRC